MCVVMCTSMTATTTVAATAIAGPVNTCASTQLLLWNADAEYAAGSAVDATEGAAAATAVSIETTRTQHSGKRHYFNYGYGHAHTD